MLVLNVDLEFYQYFLIFRMIIILFFELKLILLLFSIKCLTQNKFEIKLYSIFAWQTYLVIDTYTVYPNKFLVFNCTYTNTSYESNAWNAQTAKRISQINSFVLFFFCFVLTHHSSHKIKKKLTNWQIAEVSTYRVIIMPMHYRRIK